MNRVSVEFDMLYRWHQLIPNNFTLNGVSAAYPSYFFDSNILTNNGIGSLILSAILQPANRYGPKATPSFLAMLDIASIDQGRTLKLGTLNMYRRRYGLPPYHSIEELTGENSTDDVTRLLHEAYEGDIDRVEFYIGLICERKLKDIFPETLTTMVLAHAMKGIFSNPILSPENWRNLDPIIRDIVENTHVGELIARNAGIPQDSISFSYK